MANKSKDSFEQCLERISLTLHLQFEGCDMYAKKDIAYRDIEELRTLYKDLRVECLKTTEQNAEYSLKIRELKAGIKEFLVESKEFKQRLNKNIEILLDENSTLCLKVINLEKELRSK